MVLRLGPFSLRTTEARGQSLCMNWPRDRTTSTLLIVGATGMAISAVLGFMAMTPIWDIAERVLAKPASGPDDWDKLTYQGYYGAWVQAGSGLVAALFAIGGGALAFFGAIRAGRYTLEAAERSIEAARQAEQAARAEKARNLAEVWLPQIRATLADLRHTEFIAGRLRADLYEEAKDEWKDKLPEIFTMDVLRLEPLGSEAIQSATQVKGAWLELERIMRITSGAARAEWRGMIRPQLAAEWIQEQHDKTKQLVGNFCDLLERIRMGKDG